MSIVLSPAAWLELSASLRFLMITHLTEMCKAGHCIGVCDTWTVSGTYYRCSFLGPTETFWGEALQGVGLGKHPFSGALGNDSNSWGKLRVMLE